MITEMEQPIPENEARDALVALGNARTRRKRGKKTGRRPENVEQSCILSWNELVESPEHCVAAPICQEFALETYQQLEAKDFQSLLYAVSCTSCKWLVEYVDTGRTLVAYHLFLCWYCSTRT